MSGAELARLAAEVGAHLKVWETRDQPEVDGAGVRRAANNAVDAIDELLRLLHQRRTALVSEVRRFDDLLRKHRDCGGAR